MTTCAERLETKTEIISGPNKSLGDKEGQSGRYPGFVDFTRLIPSCRRKRRSVSPDVQTVNSSCSSLSFLKLL